MLNGNAQVLLYSTYIRKLLFFSGTRMMKEGSVIFFFRTCMMKDGGVIVLNVLFYIQRKLLDFSGTVYV